MPIDKLSEFVDIRFANRDDVGLIMDHYRRHWDSAHIFANDLEFILYEHLADGRFNFVIALNKGSNDILAAIGFADYGRYGECRHVTSTMLSVSNQCQIPFLGIEMIRALKKLTKSTSYSGVTTNPVTVAPYVKRFLKHKVDFFDHLYIVNPNFLEYKILLGSPSYQLDCEKKCRVSLKEVFNFDEIFGLKCLGVKQRSIPYKSLAYISRRYFSHPIFNYRFFVCHHHLDASDALLIVRVESALGRTILRVIDFIGPLDMLNEISYCLRDLIESEGHEYCDLFCSNAQIFLGNDHCFLDRKLSNVVIPHYFHPFFPENIDVLYETDESANVYFKGDGDGDRPTRRMPL